MPSKTDVTLHISFLAPISALCSPKFPLKPRLQKSVVGRGPGWEKSPSEALEMPSGGREDSHSCAAGALKPLTGAQLPGPGTPEMPRDKHRAEMGEGVVTGPGKSRCEGKQDL